MRKIAGALLIVMAVVAAYLIGTYAWVSAATAELSGRYTETRRVYTDRAGDATCSLTLLLHRLLPDENAVELSMVLDVPPAACDAPGSQRFIVTVRDGLTDPPFHLVHQVVHNCTSIDGLPIRAVSSPRFVLPASPSVVGFPFDDINLRPMVTVYRNENIVEDVDVYVRKAVPGRIMYISGRKDADIRLTRLTSEKALVVALSATFLVLSAVLAVGLLTTTTMTTLDELLAVGGYIVAAAGFREVLGLSRTAGITALEAAVIGVPVVVLALAAVVSLLRGRFRRRRHAANSATMS